MWANVKWDAGRITLEGHYPVILACKGKPEIHLDQDTDAWMRRFGRRSQQEEATGDCEQDSGVGGDFHRCQEFR